MSTNFLNDFGYYYSPEILYGNNISFNNKYVYRAKVAFTSSGTDSPKLQSIGLRMTIKDVD